MRKVKGDLKDGGCPIKWPCSLGGPVLEKSLVIPSHCLCVCVCLCCVCSRSPEAAEAWGPYDSEVYQVPGGGLGASRSCWEGSAVLVLRTQALRPREVGNSGKVTQLENSLLEIESNFTSAILMVDTFP